MSGVVRQNSILILVGLLIFALFMADDCLSQDEKLQEVQLKTQYAEKTIDDIHKSLKVLRDLSDNVFTDEALDELYSTGKIIVTKGQLGGIDIKQLDWRVVSQLNINNVTRMRGIVLNDQRLIAKLELELCKATGNGKTCDIDSLENKFRLANDKFLLFMSKNHWIE